MNEQNQWYVTIQGNAVGPVSTDLVVRGIKHKKIATNAYVCVVGATEWQLLADVEEFYAAMCEGGLLDSASHNGFHHEHAQGTDVSQALPESDSSAAPAVVTAVAEPGVGESVAPVMEEPGAEIPAEPLAGSAAAPAPINGTSAPINGTSAPINGKHVDVAHEVRPLQASIDLDIDVTVDDSPLAAIDWNRGFAAYFLVGTDIALPDEHALLRSLAAEPHDTFLNDEAMWNLALCLAFGSDTVADKAASVFFDVVAAHGLHERIDWMCRTLLSKGFMPSGIPHSAGYRGLTYLQRVCPAGLLPKLEAEAAS